MDDKSTPSDIAAEVGKLADLWTQRTREILELEISDDDPILEEVRHLLHVAQIQSMDRVVASFSNLVQSLEMYIKTGAVIDERWNNIQISRLVTKTLIDGEEIDVKAVVVNVDELPPELLEAVNELREASGLEPCSNPKCPVHGPQVRDDTRENN